MSSVKYRKNGNNNDKSDTYSGALYMRKLSN